MLLNIQKGSKDFCCCSFIYYISFTKNDKEKVTKMKQTTLSQYINKNQHIKILTCSVRKMSLALQILSA